MTNADVDWAIAIEHAWCALVCLSFDLASFSKYEADSELSLRKVLCPL